MLADVASSLRIIFLRVFMKQQRTENTIKIKFTDKKNIDPKQTCTDARSSVSSVET